MKILNHKTIIQIKWINGEKQQHKKNVITYRLKKGAQVDGPKKLCSSGRLGEEIEGAF